MFYALVATSILMNTIGARVFPKFEAIALVLHVTGSFAILITLLYLSPKNSASDVFNVFINGDGFETDAQSWLVGTVSVTFLFNGKRLA